MSGNDAVQVMVVNFGATLNLENLTVANSLTDLVGGGIDNLGTLTVTRSTFSGNSALFGGGIQNGRARGSSGAASLTVTNSTFSGNSASGGGGGIK